MAPSAYGSASSAALPLLLADPRPDAGALAELLIHASYQVHAVTSAEEALAQLGRRRFGAVVCHAALPWGKSGPWLNAARELDAHVPVIVLQQNEPLPLDDLTGSVQEVVLPMSSASLLEVIAQTVLLYQVSQSERQHHAGFALGALPHRMHSDLQRRLQGAQQSLYMAYQPIVDCRSKQLFGYEALVRSSEVSMPTPADLFAGAEQLGRLFALGRQIRGRVASDLCDEVVPDACPIFVNLHARDLLDSELFDARSPLSQHAHRVVFELTERTALDAVVDATVRIARLRALGFRIAVDDLGAGFAGLSTFAEFEPEVVKLDMSIVRDLPTQPRKRAVVHALVQMCDTLQVRMIAEGVETAEERDQLLALGCPLLQGYLFGRPQRGFARPTSL